METWDVETTQDAEEPYFFRNSSRTLITYSKRIKFNISILLVEMEQRGVPFKFTEKLKELRMTILQDCGNYLKGVIQLSSPGWGPGYDQSVCQTFVHELGHHIDEQEAIAADPNVIREKKRAAKHLPDNYAQKNVDEYVACGFEVFYFGSKEERKNMRKRNKHLYKRISQAHRKYRSS